MFVVNDLARVVCWILSVSRKVVEMMEDNSRAGWKDLTKEKKECSCSWESELAAIQSSI